eukprot:TRINITY_DN2242_c0_g2_i1.p1 TRINITY_DN2242_c0_g2~~TRINITY_DN2242_c0_g2_i1.p1  ORF type:complete len:149 (+),score=23.81 TRINITY_DN2242_c0_g2_i1:66-512(+)
MFPSIVSFKLALNAALERVFGSIGESSCAVDILKYEEVAQGVNKTDRGHDDEDEDEDDMEVEVEESGNDQDGGKRNHPGGLISLKDDVGIARIWFRVNADALFMFWNALTMMNRFDGVRCVIRITACSASLQSMGVNSRTWQPLPHLK